MSTVDASLWGQRLTDCPAFAEVEISESTATDFNTDTWVYEPKSVSQQPPT